MFYRSCWKLWWSEFSRELCFEQQVLGMQGVRGILLGDEGLVDRLVYEAILGIVETLIDD